MIVNTVVKRTTGRVIPLTAQPSVRTLHLWNNYRWTRNSFFTRNFVFSVTIITALFPQPADHMSDEKLRKIEQVLLAVLSDNENGICIEELISNARERKYELSGGDIMPAILALVGSGRAHYLADNSLMLTDQYATATA